MYTSETLQKHLATEHKISPFSQYLREIVYGGNDGIVTTFAVVAGFAGAAAHGSPIATSYLIILLFGIANLLSDGAAMGLGNFLSIRSNKDVYRAEKRKEAYEIDHNPHMEIAETQQILMEKGYSKTDAQEMTKLYAKNKEYWLEFMMGQELSISNPEGDNPTFTALATFISFATFGIMPLLPYIFIRNAPVPFVYSIVTTVAGLMLLGVLRWKITRESIIRSIGEVVLIGGSSAIIAYVVGTFFRG